MVCQSDKIKYLTQASKLIEMHKSVMATTGWYMSQNTCQVE